MIAQMITDDLVEGDDLLKAEIIDLIQKLIARKNRYFPEYKRMILDFELKDVGRGYHLGSCFNFGEQRFRGVIRIFAFSVSEGDRFLLFLKHLNSRLFQRHYSIRRNLGNLPR